MSIESVAPPGPDEIIARIKATDPSALRSAARALSRAADQLTGVQGKLSGLSTSTINVWNGDGGTAFLNHVNETNGYLGSGRYGFQRMAELLGEIASAAEEAQAEVRRVERELAEADGDVTRASQSQVAGDAIRVAQRYHEAEQRIRKQLWSLGDAAPVGKAPTPTAPPVPDLPWWQELLFGSPPGSYYIKKDGQLYGVDEDGNLVPAHHGAAIPIEIKMAGWGALFRLIPGLVRSAPRAGARATGPALQKATDAMKGHIAGSAGWRTSHIAPKVKQWFNLPDSYPTNQIPRWMFDEYLNVVAGAAVRSGGVIRGSLRGQQTNLVLHYDQTTKRWLCVQFWASGSRAGQFASSFRPNPAQLDALLRAGATVRTV